MAKKITANELNQIITSKEEKLHFLGDGLYLQIKGGSNVFIFRYMINGKAKKKGLQAFNSVTNTLANARARAIKLKAKVKNGIDPKEEEQLESLEKQKRLKELSKARKLEDATFERIALETIDAKKHRWTSTTTADQWESSLRQYAFPFIGNLPVSEIDTDHVYDILKPIWYTKTETADRVRRRIESVLSRAKTLKLRTGENPALWRDHLSNLFDSPKAAKDARAPEENRHHPSLPYEQLPAFMAQLRRMDGMGARALEICVLHANRTSEVLGAKWDEIDLNARIWSIPAIRMKKKIAHTIPLTDQAVEILATLKEHKISDYVFPNISNGKHLSQAGMSSVLKRMQKIESWKDELGRDISTHGFRTTFRTYIANETAFDGEIAEFALSHKLKDKAQAAYQQGNLLSKRRVMMQHYSDYAYGESEKKVIQLRTLASN